MVKNRLFRKVIESPISFNAVLYYVKLKTLGNSILLSAFLSVKGIRFFPTVEFEGREVSIFADLSLGGFF